MTDKEKGKLKQVEDQLTDEQKRDALREIQSSIFKSIGGRHMMARFARKYHRHHSKKAVKQKKARRSMAKKSRQTNARKRKRK